MATITLTTIQALEFIILGMENGHYAAAKDLAKVLIETLKEREEEEKKKNE